MVFSKYDGDTINTVLNGNTKIKEALSGAYQKAGFELLGIEQNATYRLATSNRALNKLEDYRGIKIRTMENKNHMKFWSAIGAEPTPLAFGEVYISLQMEQLMQKKMRLIPFWVLISKKFRNI